MKKVLIILSVTVFLFLFVSLFIEVDEDLADGQTTEEEVIIENNDQDNNHNNENEVDLVEEIEDPNESEPSRRGEFTVDFFFGEITDLAVVTYYEDDSLFSVVLTDEDFITEIDLIAKGGIPYDHWVSFVDYIIEISKQTSYVLDEPHTIGVLHPDFYDPFILVVRNGIVIHNEIKE